MKLAKRNFPIATLVLWMVFSSFLARASHVSGGDISYQCIGADSFLVTLNLFRDCDGITMSASEMITVSNSCGGSTTLTVNQDFFQEVSQLCPSYLPQSSCQGGTYPGMEIYSYSGILVLNPTCAGTWNMSWSTCCRNVTVNVPTSSSEDIYIEATLNTLNSPCNNSPLFENSPSAFPFPFRCQGQPVSYNYGVIESDGDSLVYSLICAMDVGAVCLPYTTPYSATNPIDGIVIDSQTGQISFTPNAQGNFIVVVQIEEYDNNGNLIGTVMRDIQFTILPPNLCSQNNTPPLAPSTLSNFMGSGVQVDSNSVEMCTGDNVCFDIVISDTDVGDVLTLFTNVDSVLNGVIYNITGTNPATLSVCWTATGGSNPFNSFTVTAMDSACPIPSVITLSYDVTVVSSTYAGPDQIICGSQSALLDVTGGSVFNWSSISGDPIAVGTNFSCNPCGAPLSSPTATTTYEVVSDLSGTCVNRDTVTVNVVPDFSHTISQSDDSICLQESVMLGIVPGAAGAFTYNWTPASLMDNAISSNPTATVTSPGTQWFYVEATSPDGCIKKDSMFVEVSNSLAPVISATAVDSFLCDGGSTTLGITFGSTAPVNCGISLTGCSGPSYQITLGTGTATNGTTSYPAPYGNWYWGSKHQVLYTASELNAMGFIGGQITELAWDVATVNGTSSYQNFELKMGCTNLTQLSTWQTGLNTVYLAPSYTVTTGWNSHTFDDAFDWDGISNVILEVCFNNSSYTNNCETYFTPTSFQSVIYYRADNATVCSAPGTANPVFDRPNIMFTYCDAVIDTNNYTYRWDPSIGLNNATVKSPIASPLSTTTYTVTVSDIIGGCDDISQVTINVSEVMAGPDTTVCSDTVQLWATGTMCDPVFESFSWSPALGLSDTTISNPVAYSTGSTDYVVTYFDGCGCTATDTVTITSIADIGVQFTADSTSGCEPHQVQFENLSVMGDDCFWNFGDGGQGVGCDSVLYTYQNAGNYNVQLIVNTNSGCSDTLEISQMINVSDIPTADFTYLPNPANVLNPEITFFDKSSGAIAEWYWTFYGQNGNEMDNSYSSQPVITYPEEMGIYPVSLTVSTSEGCSATDSNLVTVVGFDAVYFPRAFSPDDDGLNEYFGPITQTIDVNEYQMRIFDRWGAVVYETKNVNDPWDGNVMGRSGKPAPPGVYVYIVLSRGTIDRSPVEFVGHVTLMR